MESFSRTLDTYTGSYLAQRRRKRIALLLAVVALLALAAAIVLRLERAGSFTAATGARAVSRQKILADWKARKWDEVRAATMASLASKPLDPFYLTFSGLAAFYKAVELPEGDDRAALLGESIAALRKVLAAGGRVPRAQVHYVLGKAYYDKGPSFYDESIKYMEASISEGYAATDSREYLALAYAGLGDKAKAILNFEAALAKNRADLLLLATAKAYVDAGDGVKAEALLLEALSTGTDALAREKCRFLLGDIYRSRGDGAKAEQQYNLVLEKNPDSAEAHYRLGVIYQDRGDPVRARAEWRKAVAIDPMHAASRQKLTEKL